MKPSPPQPVLDDSAPLAEQAERDEHPVLRDGERLRVGQHLPAALTDRELMELLGLHKSRFYALKKLGAFDRWQLRPALGSRHWSGALVERWLNCQDGASRFALTVLRKKRA